MDIKVNQYEWNVFFYFKDESDEDEQTFAETVMENMNLANMYYPVSESPYVILEKR